MRTSLISAGLVGLLCATACSGTEGMPGSSFSAHDAPAPPAVATGALSEIERDLTLTLRRTTSDPFEFGRDPRFEVVLTNRSTQRSHAVVTPSDGSESGWREPHVFYTVEMRTSAHAPWVAAPELRSLRCGNYDVDWTKDVVALDPGKELVLPWFEFRSQWDLEGASHVRIVAHYKYGDHARDLRKVPPALHTTPAYTLSSNAMELAVEPPLTLEVAWKGVLPENDEPLARSVDVTVVNRGKATLPLAAADTGGNLSIVVEGVTPDGQTSRHSTSSSSFLGNANERIAPGARRSVVGAARAHDADFPTGFRPRRVRAVLHVWWYTDEAKGESDERIASSPWVTIP